MYLKPNIISAFDEDRLLTGSAFAILKWIFLVFKLVAGSYSSFLNHVQCNIFQHLILIGNPLGSDSSSFNVHVLMIYKCVDIIVNHLFTAREQCMCVYVVYVC